MSNFKKQNIEAIEEKYYEYLPRLDVLKRAPLPDNHPLTIHMTCINHLDLSWGWCFADTIEMALETIRWQVQMIEEMPDVVYSHTQVISLKIIERMDPGLFERMARLVEKGAIVFDSGQVAESDLNLPSGESLARQFLYGQRYLLEKFGTTAEVFINSDSFGMFRNLPQLLKKSGLNVMMFKRPREDGDFPRLVPFCWQGLDGTEIPAMHFDNKRHGLPYKYDEVLPENYKYGIHHLFSALCNSDAGGVTPYCRPFSQDGYTIKYDTPAAFFQSVLKERPDLPLYKDLLNYEQRGCYTTHIEEKANMRRTEMELRQNELLWSMLSTLGYEYPYAELESNWWRFSFLQFHDIVTGTGCPQSHVESNAQYCEIFRSLLESRRKAQLTIDGFVDQTDKIRSFLVLSEREIRSGEVVTADVNLRIHCEDHLSPLIPDTGCLVDEKGGKVPYQLKDRRHFQRYMRATMMFQPGELEQLSMARFDLLLGNEQRFDGPIASGNQLENRYYIIKSENDGVISSMYDKENDRELLSDPDEISCCLELWPESKREAGENNAWILGIDGNKYPAVPIGECEIVDSGPVRATLRRRFIWGKSNFTVDVSLLNNSREIEIFIDSDWHEHETLLRFFVNPALEGKRAINYGLPFGVEQATTEEQEIPAVGWVDMSDEKYGMAILDRGNPGHTFVGNAMRVSLARSLTLQYGVVSDSGRIETRLRLLPHSGTFREAGIPESANRYNNPAIGWQVENFGTEDKAIPTLFRFSEKGIGITAVKAAEDRTGYILRLVENHGERHNGILTIGPAVTGGKVFECDVLENVTRELRVSESAVDLEFFPYEIKTVFLCTDHPLSPTIGSPDIADGIFNL